MTTAYDPANIFAKILRDELPAHNIYEDDATLVIMDIMPVSDGHVLVLPKTPARNLLDVEPDSLARVIATTQKLARAAKAAFSADGVAIYQFNEPAAGQTVYHLHFHVVPRFEGVAQRPHGARKEDDAVLVANAGKLRAALKEFG